MGSCRNPPRRMKMTLIGLIIPATVLCGIPVLQVDAAYGKVSVPKCHTEYDTETSYDKRCSTTYEQECERDLDLMMRPVMDMNNFRPRMGLWPTLLARHNTCCLNIFSYHRSDDDVSFTFIFHK